MPGAAWARNIYIDDSKLKNYLQPLAPLYKMKIRIGSPSIAKAVML